ncbi:hypothetical protein MO973_20500 [Paenibacillus sp. TRM 82003]|nr:hypothetical protein [Paenibacillus sp. TRM 82003]
MAETYRKAKIEHYVASLTLRKKTIAQQIAQEALQDKKDYLQGQLCAIELIVNELQAEFHLSQLSQANEPMPPKEE